MRPLLPLAGLLVVAALACSPRAERAGPPDPALLPSLQVSTEGDSVRFVLQVTNTTEAPVELTFPSGRSYDFAVLDGDRAVWRWSEGRMFTQAVRNEVLRPGETLTYAESWAPDPTLAGEFTAVGTLAAAGHPVEQRTEFRLR